MKSLIVGLGSMGKRRIRCLQALGYTQIIGFDLRADRREESETKYGITTVSSFEDGLKHNPDVCIISVPPDLHGIYIEKSVNAGLPNFSEVSLVPRQDLIRILELAKQKKILCVPSATMLYHTGITMIGEVIQKQELGKISHVLYHMGHSLLDWHPWEKISDYYVSKKETGAAREIVPFELTWLTQFLGFPKAVCGVHKKTIELPGAPDIDDVYTSILDYDGFVVTLMIDCVSRYATRRLTINGDKKQLVWSWDEHKLNIYDPETQTWEHREYAINPTLSAYNQNISEDMYIKELDAFLRTVKGEKVWINTFENDLKNCDVLEAMEASYQQKRYMML